MPLVLLMGLRKQACTSLYEYVVILFLIICYVISICNYSQFISTFTGEIRQWDHRLQRLKQLALLRNCETWMRS